MDITKIQVNVNSAKEPALLTAVLSELGVPIRVVTAHPDYYVIDNDVYCEDLTYINSFNAKHEKQIHIISTEDFLKELLENVQAKEVYERLSKVYSGFKIDNRMCVYKYTGDSDDLIIPDGVTGIANNYWCHSEFNSIVVPASFSFIGAYMFEPIKSVKIVVFEGNHNCTNGVLKDTECVTIFEQTALYDLPSSLKKKAALGFVVDYYTNGNINSDFMMDYIAYIKRQKNSLKSELLTNLDLLRFVIEKRIFPEKEIKDILLDACKDESRDVYVKKLLRIGVSQKDKEDYVNSIIISLKEEFLS